MLIDKLMLIKLCPSLFTVTLKVLTNDKRGLLKVVAFDKSPIKLFTLKFFKQICSILIL
jgi:hypothetical protein